MYRSTKWYSLGVLAIGAQSIGALTLVAQDTPQRNAASATATDKSQNKQLDEFVASCLILGNQNEIATAKLAEQKAENPEVKSFAQMMQKDHSKFMNEMAKFAKNDFTSRNTSLTAHPSATTTTEKPNNPDRRTTNDQSRPAAAGSEGLNDIQLQIHQEIADECLATTRRELSAKQGAEFDSCYVDSQVAAHMHMIDQMKVLERHVSAPLQSQIREGHQVAQKHLDHAKQIKKTLADTSRKSTADSNAANRAAR